MEKEALDLNLGVIKLNSRLSKIKKSLNSSRLKGKMTMRGFSKFSEKIKSDMEIEIPMKTEIMILCEGQTKDGIIRRKDLEESLSLWSDLPIIDFHDDSRTDPTVHKMSDRKGYTTGEPQLKIIDGKMWLVTPAEIINRDLAYQVYIREKRGKPLEVSAEFGRRQFYLDGENYLTDYHPHLIAIVDKGNIKGNSISIQS